MGHSVGSYILLEILQRLRKSESPLNITAAILLTPTVTHIAKSSSGIITSGLFRIPGFARGASLVANTLLWPIPKSGVKWLVKTILSMPEEGAEVTARFLKSNMGIWQALHLAEDEMATITEDKWDEDIWGIEQNDDGNARTVPKLIFYFAEKVDLENEWLFSLLMEI
jgi:hypothetical protein